MEFPEQIAIGLIFFRFAYVLSLGFWQIVAARYGIRALSWLPRGATKLWGYVVGSLIMGAVGAGFFATRSEEIFSPGPASSEFLFFLSLALLCGLFTCLAISSAEDALSRGPKKNATRGETIETKWWRGALYVPPSGPSPHRVVCAVPEGGEGGGDIHAFGSSLAREGTAVLVIDLYSGGMWRYPDVLAAIPQAVAVAEAREELDASRLGLLGIGVGGDLAARAAASDQQITALVIISPVLDQGRVEPGLDLLRDMSYLDALHWRHRNGDADLVRQLGALEQLPRIPPRALLVIRGEMDAMAGQLRELEHCSGGRSVAVPGEGRMSVIRSPAAGSSAAEWFAENL